MTNSRSIPPVPAALAARLAKMANPEVVAGTAVTVVRDAEPVGFWSTGYASLPFRVPVTEQTLFHIGSVGKHITALAVMQLVDAGAVGLDARLGSYVQGLPDAWANMPVRGPIIMHYIELVHLIAFWPIRMMADLSRHPIKRMSRLLIHGITAVECGPLTMTGGCT